MTTVRLKPMGGPDLTMEMAFCPRVGETVSVYTKERQSFIVDKVEHVIRFSRDVALVVKPFQDVVLYVSRVRD